MTGASHGSNGKSIDMIKNREQLSEWIERQKQVNPTMQSFQDYWIAVEGLIFDREGKLVLVLRGPNARDERFKLEGIGGCLTHMDGDDLQRHLLNEISQEIGDDVEISIDRMLEVRRVQFKDAKKNQWIDWVVVSYLCRIVKGEPINNEEDNHLEIRRLSLDELMSHPVEPEFGKGLPCSAKNLIKPGLSKSLVMGREVYAERYGNQPYYLCPS